MVDFIKILKIEHRSLIKFFTKALTSKEVKQHFDYVYEDFLLSYSTVKLCTKNVRLGREFVEDYPEESDHE